MTNTIIVVLSTLLLISAILANPIHNRRSGSWPEVPCTATLKKANGKNAVTKPWYMPWKDERKTWQCSWPSGATGRSKGHLFVEDGNDCKIWLEVILDTCSFDYSKYNVSHRGSQKHHFTLDAAHKTVSSSQDIFTESSTTNSPPGSPITDEPPNSPVVWYGCDAGMKIHLDF
ncbi:hypothetical protein O181_031641 [Austropuccinia psidii MF-1]|uniref:Uncharacterized protein n=1 Tax=Austropuccinia psidii MF-1 TaxID=1389203 RepID=A0A9Q3CV94_9BASI|nr:hypothetical protein [Austropuccinia psidii MF-1]